MVVPIVLSYHASQNGVGYSRAGVRRGWKSNFQEVVWERVTLQEVCGMENSNQTRKRYTFFKSQSKQVDACTALCSSFMWSTCNILLWWRIFLLSKVYRRILKVIKHILFVSKTARLVPCFTIFTGEKNRRYRVTLEKKSPLNYTRRLTSSLGPSLHLHRETSAMQVVE